MDYYELFGIQASPIVDKILIKIKYLELSRKHHPDFADNSDPQETETVLNLSALINKAYKVFTNPSLSIQYFLQYKQVIVDDEKYPLPNDFLMEMMDINEQLEEAKLTNDVPVIQKVKKQIEEKEAALYKEIQEIVESSKADNLDTKELKLLKTYYYQKKYIHRILDGID